MKDLLSQQNNTVDCRYDTGAGILRAMLLAKNNVPQSHRRVADNYVVIKRLYNFHAVKAAITVAEYNLLNEYNFQPLECTTLDRVNDEIEALKSWSFSKDSELRRDADYIIVIRAKELKNIVASAYSNVPNEIYYGYKALDKYFDEITKFYK